jgi:hypothetical protein
MPEQPNHAKNSDQKKPQKLTVAPTPRKIAEQLIQNRTSTDDLKNKQNSHRVTAITSVAKIDDDLLRLLKATFAQTTDDRDDLLVEGGVIGTLVLRAKLCMRMRLISPTLYTLIKDLADIRNDCAHKPQDFNVFEADSTKDKLNNHWNRMNPNLFDRSIVQTEKRFTEICSYVNTYLEIQIRETKGGVLLKNEVLFIES